MSSTIQTPGHNVHLHMSHRTPIKHTRANSPQGSEAGLYTPPPSQSHGDSAASMLMSPPPEETLRTPRAKSTPASSHALANAVEQHERFGGHVISNTQSSKRKRKASSLTTPSSRRVARSTSVDMDSIDELTNSQNVTEATPNPKPRKQSKRAVSFAPESPAQTSPTKASRKRTSTSPSKRLLLLSPHSNNPQADYIPPSASTSHEHLSPRRRSVTPIPPYEPPAEKFTPPREVLCTPINLTTPKVSKSSKRKSAVKNSGKKLVLQIKKELPDDIDLSVPPPPASPTDDPLLLLGHKRRTRSSLNHGRNSLTHSRETPPLESSSPIHGDDFNQTRLMDLTMGAAGGMDMTSDDFTITGSTSHDVLPVFNPVAEAEDAWTDDEGWGGDGDNPASPFDHTGEFTGNFTVLTVPTKVDPPSSCTKSRMDAWGHPVSPFPGRARSRGLPDEGEDFATTPAKRLVEILPADPDLDVGDGEKDVFGTPLAHQAAEPMAPIIIRRSHSPSTPPLATTQSDVLVSASPMTEGHSPDVSVSEPHINEQGPEQEEETVIIPAPPLISRKSPHPLGPFDFDQSFGPDDDITQDEITIDSVVPLADASFEEEDHTAQYHEEESYASVPDVESDAGPDILSDSIVGGTTQLFDEIGALVGIHPQAPERRSVSPVVRAREATSFVAHSISPQAPSRPVDADVSVVRHPFISEAVPTNVGVETSLGTTIVEEEVPNTVLEEKPEEPLAGPSSPHQTEEHIPSSPLSSLPSSPILSRPLPTEVPRTPAPQVRMDDSDDEEDDEVSVFRELSQPPEGDSDADEEGQHDQGDSLVTPFARVSLRSPSNPFQPDTPTPNNRGSGAVRLEHSPSPQQRVMVDEDEAISESDSEDEEMDEKVIKITSDDPRAAARAAAILRLHRYNCLEEYNRRKRRHSHSGVDSILQKSRHRTSVESGVSKTSSLRRRRTLGGMIGDKVYIPGSPAITLPELLNEAEVSVHLEGEDIPRSPYSPIKLPVPAHLTRKFETPTRRPNNSFLDPNDIPSLCPTPITLPSPGPRDWSKDDWKLLDGCYTEERMALGERLGMGYLGDEGMASADDVDLENVVDRYVTLIGGQGVAEILGEPWSRENLTKRTRALQRKQRSGNVAPPTPVRASSVLSNDTISGGYQRFMSSMSPELGPSRDVSYLRLLDEATTVEKKRPEPPIISYLKNEPPKKQSTLGRVKGFFFSYLGGASKQKPPPPKTPAPAQPGYPLPPPELFNKERAPIATPASKPPPKAAHPKEIVQLQPAPLKSSTGSQSSKNPRRLVELNHVDQQPKRKTSSSSLVSLSRERRGSNASVKDLVNGFEEMQRRQSMELEKERESLSRLEVRRVRSIREWNAGASRTNVKAKPVWRP